MLAAATIAPSFFRKSKCGFGAGCGLPRCEIYLDQAPLCIQVIELYRFVNKARGSVLANRVRLARTSAERRRGLLRTTTLHSDAGLWLVPCEAIHTFGMQVAIDAVFLDKELRVCGLRPHLRPSRAAFSWRAHSVLELPAGTIARSGTVLGDQLVREPSLQPVRDLSPAA